MLQVYNKEIRHEKSRADLLELLRRVRRIF